MEGSRSSVSTLHPREHSDVLTNSTAPRADNYFCARADLAFASSFTASFPLSLSLSSPLPFSSHFRANEFFVDRKHENPTPRLPFCTFFARPWGGRGEGYAGAWWPLQRFKSPQRTPREPPPLQRAFPFRATLLWRRCTPRGVGPPPRTGNVLEGGNRGN